MPRRLTGSAPAQGAPTAAVKVVGGSGGGGTKKVGIDDGKRFSAGSSYGSREGGGGFGGRRDQKDDGKRSCAGSTYGSREGGGGFGVRRDQKDRNRRRFGDFLFVFFQLSQIPKKPLALQRRIVF